MKRQNSPGALAAGSRSTTDSNTISNRCLPFVLFMVALIITLGGVSYYRHQAAEKPAIAQDSLAIVADLKVKEFANWIRERHSDAEVALRGFEGVVARFKLEEAA